MYSNLSLHRKILCSSKEQLKTIIVRHLQCCKSFHLQVGSFYVNESYSYSFMNVSFEKGLYRVRTGPGKPGKSWNFTMAFSRTGKSWEKTTGPGKFWKSVKHNIKNINFMEGSKEN